DAGRHLPRRASVVFRRREKSRAASRAPGRPKSVRRSPGLPRLRRDRGEALPRAGRAREAVAGNDFRSRVGGFRLWHHEAMTLDEFRQTLTARAVPEMAPLLRALWHDAQGDWTRAHEIAQEVEDSTGAWVHAYLHRKEGDLGNAGYWYRRA